jgi:hypothetical protein
MSQERDEIPRTLALHKDSDQSLLAGLTREDLELLLS